MPRLPVHYGHDCVDGDAVLHGEYLDTSHFSTLHDFPLPVILDGECTRLDFSGKFLKHLFPVRKQVTSLAAFFSFGATEDLVERFRHIGIIGNLFHYISLPVHYSIVFFDCFTNGR